MAFFFDPESKLCFGVCFGLRFGGSISMDQLSGQLYYIRGGSLSMREKNC